MPCVHVHVCPRNSKKTGNSKKTVQTVQHGDWVQDKYTAGNWSCWLISTHLHTYRDAMLHLFACAATLQRRAINKRARTRNALPLHLNCPTQGLKLAVSRRSVSMAGICNLTCFEGISAAFLFAFIIVALIYCFRHSYCLTTCSEQVAQQQHCDTHTHFPFLPLRHTLTLHR